MHTLGDIITYVRRIIKSPSDAVISDNLIIDYINRFYLTDVDARIQVFDLKSKYQFQTMPGVDQYNMPLYDVQVEPGSQNIAMFPVYQGFLPPAYINGVSVNWQTQKNTFFNYGSNILQNLTGSIVGDGSAGPYTINLPILPNNSTPLNPPFSGILRGHVDITGIIATGVNVDPPVGSTLNTAIPSTSIFPAVYITSQDATGANVVVQDSGQFLTGNVNYGLLMSPGTAPFGYSALTDPLNPLVPYSTTMNTINYFTGVAVVNFPVAIPAGVNINVQCSYFTSGLPRSILFYNNVLTLRVPPAKQYLVELDAYLSPVAFLNSASAIPFGYMAEYIARGAARKILSDTGDMEQFQFYEPFFREQETLVWKRSQRIWTSTRSETIYSNNGYGSWNNGNNGFYNNGW
jgi:hypothetical protein